MNLSSILLLLQLALSLLVGVQKNPNATLEQKNQALLFASRAVSISSSFVAGKSVPVTSTSGTPAPAVPPAVVATTTAPTPAANPQPMPSVKSGIFVSAIGPASNRGKSVVDDLATLTVSPSGSGISLTTLKLTISGTLATSTFGPADIKLVDTSNQTVGSVAATSPCNNGSCVFTWTGFGSRGVVSAGNSLVLKLRIDSADNTTQASGNTSASFYATIQSAGDLTYNDTIDGSGSTVGLPATAVPLPLAGVVYAAGI